MKYEYPCPAGGPLVKVVVDCGDHYHTDTLLDPYYHKDIVVDVPEEIETEDDTVELDHGDLYITACPCDARGEQTSPATVLHYADNAGKDGDHDDSDDDDPDGGDGDDHGNGGDGPVDVDDDHGDHEIVARPAYPGE